MNSWAPCCVATAAARGPIRFGHLIQEQTKREFRDPASLRRQPEEESPAISLWVKPVDTVQYVFAWL